MYIFMPILYDQFTSGSSAVCFTIKPPVVTLPTHGQGNFSEMQIWLSVTTAHKIKSKLSSEQMNYKLHLQFLYKQISVCPVTAWLISRWLTRKFQLQIRKMKPPHPVTHLAHKSNKLKKFFSLSEQPKGTFCLPRANHFSEWTMFKWGNTCLE